MLDNSCNKAIERFLFSTCRPKKQKQKKMREKRKICSNNNKFYSYLWWQHVRSPKNTGIWYRLKRETDWTMPCISDAHKHTQLGYDTLHFDESIFSSVCGISECHLIEWSKREPMQYVVRILCTLEIDFNDIFLRQNRYMLKCTNTISASSAAPSCSRLARIL